MKVKFIYPVCLALCALFVLSLPGCHGHDEHTEGHDHGAPSAGDEKNRPTELKLPAHFQEILRKEMQGIDGGVKELPGLLARGLSKETGELGEKIKNSFILKSALSKKELGELVALLPAKFIELDRGFHKTAGQLAIAARKGDFKAAGAHYAKMIQACVNCHAHFAKDRFPGLANSR